MIPEAPFLFSIAGLSASFAGLAGLVLGLRRGNDMRPVDGLRLGEIVAFSFANILFCVSIIPLSLLLPGGTPDAVRLASVLVVVYLVGSTAYLVWHTRRLGIGWTLGWSVAAFVLVVATIGAALLVLVVGTIAAYEGLLVLLLGRPMLAFVLVLGSLESGSNRS